LASYLDGLQSFGVFLGFIGILTLNSLHSGIAAIGRKKSSAVRRRTMIPSALLMLASAALLVLGLREQSVLFLSFSAIGMLAGVTHLRFFARPLETRMSWWYRHMNGMGTAAVAAVTAFLVFNADRITQG